MKYLGTLFNEEGSHEEKIENRIGAMSKVIEAMRSEVLDRREMSKGAEESVQCNGGSNVHYCIGLDITKAT